MPGLPLAGRPPDTAATPRFVDHLHDVEVFRHRRWHGEPEIVEDVPAEEHDEDRDIEGDADDSAVVANRRLDELRQEIVEVVVRIGELAPVEELNHADTLVGKPGELGLIPVEDVDVPLGAVSAGKRVGHGLGEHLIECTGVQSTSIPLSGVNSSRIIRPMISPGGVFSDTTLIRVPLKPPPTSRRKCLWISLRPLSVRGAVGVDCAATPRIPAVPEALQNAKPTKQ